MKGKRGFRFIAIPFFIAAVLFGLSYVVMLLWNFSLAKVANLNEINFWQAMALLVLSKILFSPGMGGRKGPWSGRKKWRRSAPPLTEEQKEAFKHRWDAHCQPGEKKEK